MILIQMHIFQNYFLVLQADLIVKSCISSLSKAIGIVTSKVRK